MNRQTRVGLLVVAGVALFIVGLFVLASRTFLLSDVFVVRSQFDRVAGLVSGASVQYQGVNVGRVESVRLPDTPGGQITVTMAIANRARHLIRANTQAQIKSDGLVGNMIVVLVTPAGESAPVAEGEFIAGVNPFDLFEITDKALESVQGFEEAASTFEQIMQDVRNGEGTIGKLIYDPALYESFVQTTNETREVMNTLSDNAEALVVLADEATGGIESILAKVDSGDGTLAMLLNDPGVYNSFLATADTLQMISTDLRGITQSAENTANWAALGAFRFAENMEALKHNFLFKRYFEERGHMEMAPFEAREAALEKSHQDLERRMRSLYEWEQRLRAREAALDAAETGAEPGPPATAPDAGADVVPEPLGENTGATDASNPVPPAADVDAP